MLRSIPALTALLRQQATCLRSLSSSATAAELQEFHESVHDFAQSEIAPHAEHVDVNNSFPKDVNLWHKMGEFGLLGITAPPEYGGLGLGYQEHCIAMEELSRASGSIALSYGAHSNLCVNQIVRNATPEQKAKYLPKLATGEHIGALSISETGAGSDAVSMKCRAEDKGDHYLLNGTKMWCTNGPSADVVVVYAKTDAAKGAHGITAFIVEKGMAGYSTAQKMDKLGMRGSDTCELLFENCQVPKENVLGGVNQGVKVLMSGLDYERLVLAAGPVGIMQACLDTVLPYVTQRRQFEQRIGDFQLVQGKLADMYTGTLASRAMVEAVARQADAGKATRQDCAGVILYTSEKATRMALDAIQLLGGNGYINDYPTGRYLRDAKLYEIGAGTNEIRRMLIGRELVKIASQQQAL